MYFKLRFFVYLIFVPVLYGPIVMESFAGGGVSKLAFVEEKKIHCIAEKILLSCSCNDLDKLCSHVEQYQTITGKIFDYGAFLPVRIEDPCGLYTITSDEHVSCAQATLLHIAIYHNSYKIIFYLLKEKKVDFKRCKPTVKILDWKGTFKKYCQNNEEYLQNRNVYLEEVCSLLAGAALHANNNLMSYFFNKKFNPNLSVVQYALYIASMKNHKNFIELLLSYVPNIDINFVEKSTKCDLFGPGTFMYFTPLLAAVSCGCEDVVALLLNKDRLDLNKKMQIRQLVAVKKTTANCSSYILENNQCISPLTFATMCNQPQIVQMLIKRGVNTSIADMKELLVNAAQTNAYDAMIQMAHLCEVAKDVLQLSGNNFFGMAHPFCVAVLNKCYDMAFILWLFEYFGVQPSSSKLNLEALRAERLMLCDAPESGRLFLKNERDNALAMCYAKKQFFEQCSHCYERECPLLTAVRANNFLAVRGILSDMIALQNTQPCLKKDGDDQQNDPWLDVGLHIMLCRDIETAQRDMHCDGSFCVDGLLNAYYSVGDHIEFYLSPGIEQFNMYYKNGFIQTIRVTLLFAACQSGHWAMVYYLFMQPGVNVTTGIKIVAAKDKEMDRTQKNDLEALEKTYTPYLAAYFGGHRKIMKLLESHASFTESTDIIL